MSPIKPRVRSSGASARTKVMGNLVGGRIRLEKLPTTKNISARTYIQGKYVRKSTGESNLSKAKDVALEWFKELISRDQKGQRIHGATFADYVKFDLLVENYSDYERQLLELALHHALRVDSDWASFQSDIAAVSRRVANLLSAAKLYLDQTKHDLSSAFGSKSDVAAAIIAKTNEQYDNRFGYRVLEALRNVMQHRSIPVHVLSIPLESAGGNLRYRACPQIEVSRLKGDKKMNAKVYAEMEAKSEAYEWTPLIRDYVEGLSQVHETFRALTQVQTSQWDEVLATAHMQATEPNGSNPKSLVLALKLDDADHVLETVQVFKDLTTYRQSLERRNRVLTALTRRYVSSEVVEKDT